MIAVEDGISERRFGFAGGLTPAPFDFLLLLGIFSGSTHTMRKTITKSNSSTTISAKQL